MLVERDGKKYAAVALLESTAAKGILSSLIVELNNIIFGVSGVTEPTSQKPVLAGATP